MLTCYIVVFCVSLLLLAKYAKKTYQEELALTGEKLTFFGSQLGSKMFIYLFRFPGDGDEFSEIKKKILRYRYLFIAFLVFGMIGNYTIIFFAPKLLS
jgi:hypothetical protein